MVRDRRKVGRLLPVHEQADTATRAIAHAVCPHGVSAGQCESMNTTGGSPVIPGGPCADF
jgi:hypothetical protein